MDTKKKSKYIQGIRRNTMPRAKKPTRKVTRKTTRRKSADRRRKSTPVDKFWTKVIDGMKKLLSPAFPKK